MRRVKMNGKNSSHQNENEGMSHPFLVPRRGEVFLKGMPGLKEKIVSDLEK
jgi:hypothetical protein